MHFEQWHGDCPTLFFIPELCVKFQDLEQGTRGLQHIIPYLELGIKTSISRALTRELPHDCLLLQKSILNFGTPNDRSEATLNDIISLSPNMGFEIYSSDRDQQHNGWAVELIKARQY